jgi:beta-glucosidase
MTSIDGKVDKLLSQMTLKEKAGQLNQRLLGFNCFDEQDGEFVPNELFISELKLYGTMGMLYGLFRADPWSRRTYQNGISGKNMAKTANRFQRYVIENTRLGIPILFCEDCPHGHQALDGYLLPVNLAMACTFNPPLLEAAFSVCAGQIRESGAHISLVSALDMLREPRWGRSEECYSEDPYLASQFAASAVRGLQGNTGGIIDRRHTIAVVKHFCAQGAGAGGLNAAPASIGERELREIHLPSSKACCDAGVKGFMASYNEIDGVPNHANKKLLNGILRDEFGFKGIVMADGCALDRLMCLVSTPEEAAAIGITAGIDVSLWDSVFPFLESAVEKGILPVEYIDQPVRRILRLKFEIGLFENPYMEEHRNTVPVNHANYSQSLELARQSAVLLRNGDNLLPLDASKIKTIAVIGPNSDDIYSQIGDYSASQKEGNCCTLLEGIKQLAGSCQVLFARGCGIRGDDTSLFNQAIETAQQADVVIIAAGSSSKRNFNIQFDSNGAVLPASTITDDMDCGEGLDVSDLSLGGVQSRLIAEIEKLDKPAVTVAIQGRPLCFSELKSQALICAFYPGPMGGLALAEILFGKTVPSGRLSVSLPAYPHQTDFSYNRKMAVKNLRYVDQAAEPLYPFGYGLSYTAFEYGDLKIENPRLNAVDISNGAAFTISVTVTNTGKYDAYETIQLYISAKTSPVTRRVKELKGFKKIFIRAGEKAESVFSLGKDELSVWDRDMRLVIPKTEITLYCGPNSGEGLEAAIEIC